MDRSQKLGIVLGSAGAIFGSLVWIIIMGVLLRSVFIFTTPIVLGILCVYLVISLAGNHPEKLSTIFGVLATSIAAVNMIFINLLFEKIPYKIGSVTTGKESISLGGINIFLALVFVAGTVLILKDSLKK